MVPLGEDFMSRQRKRTRLREIARQRVEKVNAQAPACFAILFEDEARVWENEWENLGRLDDHLSAKCG